MKKIFHISSNSILAKRIRRFKSLKRAYYSLIILITLYAISLLSPLLVNSKPILVKYEDNTRTYIICPQDIKVGDNIVSGNNKEIKIGNCMPLQDIPVGINIHNVEIQPGAGGKIARSAGSSVTISGLDGNYSLIKLASGEVRKIDSRALATIGILTNPDQKNIKIGKAGRSRWLGRKPHTRGVVKNPVDHPHGGGEGKSAGGRHPVSPTGQSAKGLKTRDNKRTDKYIIKRRNKRKDTK